MQTTFPRYLTPETLDRLPATDPRAMRSRADLRRINRIMGSAGIVADAVAATGAAPMRILELGAGDGSLMLRLARQLAARWPVKPGEQRVRVTLLDRQQLVGSRTIDAFERLAWNVEIVQADVLDWIATPLERHWDLGVANLFLHHFDERQIAMLFDTLGRRTDRFVACEPRRARLPLLAARLVGLIGANAVTRNDAVLSVKAGFRDRELSGLWPFPAAQWRLDEGPARLFSHRFVAARRPG